MLNSSALILGFHSVGARACACVCIYVELKCELYAYINLQLHVGVSVCVRVGLMMISKWTVAIVTLVKKGWYMVYIRCLKDGWRSVMRAAMMIMKLKLVLVLIFTRAIRAEERQYITTSLASIHSVCTYISHHKYTLCISVIHRTTYKRAYSQTYLHTCTHTYKHTDKQTKKLTHVNTYDCLEPVCICLHT